MKVDVLSIEGKKLRQVELPSAVFEAPINIDLMHQAYVRQMANARLGTHQTKVRSEVAGGGVVAVYMLLIARAVFHKFLRWPPQVAGDRRFIVVRA